MKPFAALLIATAACLAVFGAPCTAALLAVAAAVGWCRRAAGLVFVVGALGTAVPEYVARVDALRGTLDGGGPEALSTRDLAGVWLLNLGMAAGGTAVGFPEVALETALLAVPGPETRVFRSSFAMGSPAVADVVDVYAASLRGAPGPEVTLPARRVVFDAVRDHAGARVALALNPATISGVARRDGDVWRLDLQASVPVDYPASAHLRLFGVAGTDVVIDEGLYDALERRGWLHPYTATWGWRRSSPRISRGRGAP